MKKLLILSFICLVLLTSCRDYAAFSRIEQRIIVQLVGIDLQDDIYTVSIQYSMGKASDGGETKNDLKTVSGKGENMYSAIKQTRAVAGKELFLNHSQILFLGEGVIKNDAVKTIEEYLLYGNKHSTSFVAGIHGRAEDILSLTYESESTTKNKLFALLENANNTGIFPTYPIYQTLMCAYSTSGSCFIPMFKIEDIGSGAESGAGGESGGGGSSGGGSGGGSKNESGSSDSGGGESEKPEEIAGEMAGDKSVADPEIVPYGGVLIIDGNFSLFLNPEQCVGLSLIANKTNIPSINFLHNDMVCSLEIFKLRTKIIPEFDGENMTFYVNFSAITDSSYNNYQNLDDLKAPAQNAIKLKMQSVIDSVTALGGDLFLLEDSLKHRDFDSWLKVEDNWRETIKNSHFVYSADITVKNA